LNDIIKQTYREAHSARVPGDSQEALQAKSMVKAEEKYLGIKGWWLASRATSKEALCKLNYDWFGFWHFRYRQWGGFLELVSQIAP